MSQFWKMLWNEENGQDLTEYALLLVLVSLVATMSIKVIGSVVNNTFSTAAVNLNTGAS